MTSMTRCRYNTQTGLWSLTVRGKVQYRDASVLVGRPTSWFPHLVVGRSHRIVRTPPPGLHLMEMPKAPIYWLPFFAGGPYSNPPKPHCALLTTGGRVYLGYWAGGDPSELELP